MPKPGRKGLARIVAATGYSWQGLTACWRLESAFRQEALACLVLVPLALVWGDSGMEKAILIGVCLLVLIVELLNSGIEAVVDRIGQDYHDLSGLAKDLASAAVFLSLVMAAVVWGLILLG